MGADMYLCSGLTKKVEKYLPASDSFEALTDAPRTRYRHTAAAVGSQIFVFGGAGVSVGVGLAIAKRPDLTLCFPHVGPCPPVVPCYPFLGEGSSTELVHRKLGNLLLTSLLEDLDM